MRVARLTSLLAAVALGAAGLVSLAPAASASGSGSISGYVSSANYIGLSGVTVTLEEPITGTATAYSTSTDDFGSWNLDSVPAGDYVVHYSGRVSGYADDLATLDNARTYTVDDAGYTYVYDYLSSYTVPPDYEVTLVGSDGAPLSFCPRFYPADNPDSGPYGDACTTTDGVTTGIITPGSYLVEFRDDSGAYAATWIGGDGTRSTATPVTVPDTGVGDLGTVTMPVAAHIHVTIKAGDTGGVVPGSTCVNAFFGRTDVWGNNGCADDAGAISVDGLRAGTYSLQTNVQNLDYVDRWSGDSRTQAGATLVTVGAGETVSAGTITTPLGGVITGTVRDQRGKPVPGVCASTGRFGSLSQEDGTRQLYDSCSDAQGRYRIRGLDEGTVRIQFVTGPGGETPARYAIAWFGGTNHDTAAPVKVRLGGTTQGVNVTVLPEGRITGTMTDASGNRVDGFVWADDFRTGWPIDYGEDYPETAFAIGKLPTTTILLRWNAADGTPRYWDGSRYGTADRSKALPIKTKAGSVVSGIAIHLAA